MGKVNLHPTTYTIMIENSSPQNHLFLIRYKNEFEANSFPATAISLTDGLTKAAGTENEIFSDFRLNNHNKKTNEQITGNQNITIDAKAIDNTVGKLDIKIGNCINLVVKIRPIIWLAKNFIV